MAGEEVLYTFQVSLSTDVSFILYHPGLFQNISPPPPPTTKVGVLLVTAQFPPQKTSTMSNEWGKRLVKISLQSVLYMLYHYTEGIEWNCMVRPSLVFLRFGILDFWKLCRNRSYCHNTRVFLCAIIQYSKYVNMQCLRRLIDSKYINKELTEGISRGYFRDKQDKTVILSNSHIILLHGTTLWEMSDSLIIKIINESCLAWVITFMLQWPWPLSTKAYN